jgi:hypothetical protein
MSTVRIQVRRGLASEWTSANPVLAAGEMGVETNTNLFKFGNGTSTWTALAYANNSDVAIGEISQDAINNALSLGAGLTKTYDDGANSIVITVDTDVISTKTFATSQASAAQAAAIAAAATDATTKASAAQTAAAADATTKANAAQAAAEATAAADATTKANAAQAAAEDYTDTAVNSVSNSLSGYLETGERGSAGGVASLDSNAKILQSELPLGSFTADIATTGNLSANNVTVTGNLAVNGTMTTINTENFAIEDTILLMANANQSGMLDLGFVAGHNTGVFNHTGFVRDASEDKWKLFKDVLDEPTTTVNFAQGSLDALQVGRFESSEAVINNTTLTGTLSLPDSSVTSPDIADEAITTAKIADDSVTTAKIVDAQVTTEKIGNDQVTTAKIANYAVTSDKIANDSITEEKIVDESLTSAKIANGSITESKLGNDSVTTQKILDQSVTTDKVADSAITSIKIAANAISQSHMSDDSVGTNEIVGLAVTTGKIANEAVTTEKIADKAVTSEQIADLTITNAHISANALIDQSKVADLGLDLGLKAPLDGPTFTGTVVLPDTTSIGNLTSTELGYLDGITSSVQTQINNAATALSDHAGDSTNVHGIADTSLLATTANVATAKQEAIDAAAVAAENYADSLAPNYDPAGTASSTVTAHLQDTVSVHGIADTSKLVTTDAELVTLDGSLVVQGDLTVNGTNFVASATSITIEDNLLQLANQNAGNTVDLGLVVAYNDGANKHSGIVRDSSADSWKLFKGVTTEPTTTVDFTQGSLDNLSINNLTAAAIVFSDKTQTRAGVPSLTTIATTISSNTSLDALGTDAVVRDSLIPLSGAVNISFEATGNAKYAVGSSISFYQASGTGANITGSGITILSTPGSTLRTTASSVTATKVADTTWLLAGDLKA